MEWISDCPYCEVTVTLLLPGSLSGVGCKRRCHYGIQYSSDSDSSAHGDDGNDCVYAIFNCIKSHSNMPKLVLFLIPILQTSHPRPKSHRDWHCGHVWPCEAHRGRDENKQNNLACVRHPFMPGLRAATGLCSLVTCSLPLKHFNNCLLNRRWGQRGESHISVRCYI